MLGFKKMVIAGMMALTLLFGIQTTSHALTLGFNDFVNDPVIITDGGPGDSNPASGAVTFIGSIGTWEYNVTTGFSKPALGSASAPKLDLISGNITSGIGGHLLIAVVDIDFTAATGWEFDVGGTTEGSVGFKAFRDLTNSGQFTGTFFSDLGSFSTSSFSATDSGEFTPAPSGLFALGIVAEITHIGEKATSFDASLQAVPEPSVLLLMGMGLVGLWGASRKLRK